MAQSGYTPIQLYYSSTAAATPSAGNLTDGELALNTNDGKLYYKSSGGSVQLLASNAGSGGNVVGPASATDGNLAAFDGTTGKLIKQAATVTAAQGGTGQSSYTVGDLVYASGATTLDKLPDVATGNALISGGVGVAPSYGKIGLTTHVSGTLPVANGGMGATSLTSNNVILGNGTSAVQFVAPGTSGNLLTSNGTTWQSTAPAATVIGDTDSATPFETSIGYNAGLNNTGINNTFVGYQCGQANTTATNNTAIGFQALISNTGASNVAVGSNALLAQTTGGNNVAVGYNASPSNQTGSFNVAVGFGSAFTSTAGTRYTAVGYESLRASTADDNTGLGYFSGRATSTGAANTYVGAYAGDSVTTGSNNTIIGYSADASAVGVSSEIVVGASLTGKGTQTAFIGGTNGAYNAKNVTTWETTSDQRIKKNIVPFNQGLDVLNQIQVKNFEYRSKEEITELDPSVAVERSGVQIGIIAQELQQVLPQCVTENSTGVLSVNTDSLVWYLINAVKQLSAEVEQLKQR